MSSKSRQFKSKATGKTYKWVKRDKFKKRKSRQKMAKASKRRNREKK